MARTIREQLAAGVVEVEHQGQKADYDLPAWMHSAGNVLDSERALTDYLRTEGLLLPVLHQGLAQAVIGVRSVARPNVTKADPEPAFPTEGLRKKAREYRPNCLPRPEGHKVEKAGADLGKLTPEQQRVALRNAGFSEEKIDALMS